jgi:hypothetical protein
VAGAWVDELHLAVRLADRRAVVLFYTVAAADFNLAGHGLMDAAELTWQDLCDDPAGTGDTNCVPSPSTVGAASQSFIVQLPSLTTTVIHNAAHGAVGVVAAGSTVHDFVTVSGGAGNPVASGSVTIDWFLNGTCAGAPAVTSAPLALDAGGHVDATGFAFTVNSAGFRGFLAHYGGDPANPVYVASDGACEPLQVVDTQLSSTTTTAIHSAAHAAVTTVESGSIVHDFVAVTGQAGQPAPSGNVTIDWFTNNACTATPSASSGSVGPLVAAGSTSMFDATGFSQGPLAPGFYGFLAHYGGDATYTGSDGICEPLTVVDASIQVTPNGVNTVGLSHIFTAHVNVNDGNGFVNTPDGTQISFTIDSGPGGFTTANPCTTSGGIGSCQIMLTSAVTGVTTVSAHVTESVGGVVLTRNTNGVGANSGPATKTWVNAGISIAPNATNEVGQPHTFTVTLRKDTGTGTFVAAAAEHVDLIRELDPKARATRTTFSGRCELAGAGRAVGDPGGVLRPLLLREVPDDQATDLCLEVGDVAPENALPKPHAVVTGGGERASVGAEGDAIDVADAVRGARLERRSEPLVCSDVPEPYHAVSSGGGQGEPVRAERNAGAAEAGVGGQRPVELAVVAHVPQPHRAVGASRGERASVWAEGHAEHDACVAAQGLTELAKAARVPEPHDVVCSAGGECMPVGAEREAVRCRGVVVQRAELAPRAYIPEPNCAVFDSGERMAVGAEGEAVDKVGLAA